MPAGIIESIHKAIGAKFDATSGLGTGSGAATGGLHYGRVDTGTAKPYCRYTQVGPAQPDYAFGNTGSIDTWMFQFDVISEDGAVSNLLAERVITAFHRQSLTLDTGTLLCAQRRGIMPSMEPDEDKDGNELYRAMVEIEFKIQNP